MQTVGASNGLWIETMFDPQHQNVYLITIPSLVLFAIGIRRGAAIYFFLMTGLMFMRGG
ncbi:MAG: hypothetical protein AAF074_13380 [Pseudomonadota bacterium]